MSFSYNTENCLIHFIDIHFLYILTYLYTYQIFISVLAHVPLFISSCVLIYQIVSLFSISFIIYERVLFSRIIRKSESIGDEYLSERLRWFRFIITILT